MLKALDELATEQVLAVGNDLVFLPDFRASFNDLFKNKVYTWNEISYCDRFHDAILHYASTWAAKEAVYKALKQIDPTAIGWKKIEIIREKPGGRPMVVLHQNAVNYKIGLTIAHDGEYVWAIAFINQP